MTLGSGPSGGVAGTVGAFNFIRRVAFPSTTELVSIFCTLVSVSTLIALPSVGLSLSSIVWLTAAIIIGPTLVGESLTAAILLREDPVLDFRRLMGLELLSWWTLVILLPFSTLVGVTIGNGGIWVDGLLLALAISLPIRFLTIFAISSLPQWRKIVAATLVPAATFAAYAFLSPALGISSGGTVLASFGVLLSGLVLSIVSVSWLIQGVERAGSPSIGDSPMGLFRAFLQHWLKKEARPLEERLAALGSTGGIQTSILAFPSSRKTPKGCIVVSNFHPGPYRDLGSGGLASTLKSSLESAVGGVAMVPHGITNHEYNIISRDDIKEMIHQTQMHYPSGPNASTASRLVRDELEGAKVSAQLFGNTVLLTLTLAPQDMEDIPVEVLESIQKATSEKGLRAVAIDAHNSLSNQTSITPDQARKLTQAAIKALTSVTEIPQQPFKIGAASDPLKEFNLEDGIGPGGLSIIALKTGDQLAAYLTIDGNNMQTGVRDHILGMLREIGVDEGEVMTTDTHLVTGLVRSPLGYHPVGESISKELLSRKIRETVQRAINDMEDASAGFSTFKLDLRVLGSETFNSITSFVGRIAGRIGRSFFRLELATFIVALIALAFL